MVFPELVLVCALLAGAPPDITPLTLEQALREAKAANAALPVARAELANAQGVEHEARGRLGPTLAVIGDVWYVPPHFGYNDATTLTTNTYGSEVQLQLSARQPLYEGGGYRAQLAQARARVRGAVARFRATEKDVELSVRTGFSALTKLEDELRFRTAGIARLRQYLTLIQSRRAGGQGLAADVLKTRAQLAGEEANLAAVARQLAEARVAFNDVLGRDPSAPLTLAPLPPVLSPAEGPAEATPWVTTPDLASAQSDVEAASEQVEVARAARRPHLELGIQAGLLGPAFEHFSQSPLADDFGASLALFLTWDVWDFGTYAGQLEQARAQESASRAALEVQSRKARVAWDTAQVDLTGLYREVGARSRAVPMAMDAYLQAESLYRGGAGTALEVLEAYNVAIEAQAALADAVLTFRVAEATALRWGTP